MPVLPYTTGKITVAQSYSDLLANPVSISVPTLYLLEGELRYVILKPDVNPEGYTVVLDSYLAEVDHLESAADGTGSVLFDDALGHKYSLRLDEALITNPLVINIMQLINEGEPSTWEVTAGNSVVALGGGYDLAKYLHSHCLPSSDFEAYMLSHPSSTVDSYLQTPFGKEEVLFLYNNTKGTPAEITLSKHKAKLEATISSPDWAAAEGDLGYIKNKPVIPTLPDPVPEPAYKLGGSVHMGTLSDKAATTGAVVPYRTIDRIGDYSGISVVTGNITLTKDSGIYLVEAAVCGSMTMRSNDFVECIMTQSNGARIGVSLFGFHGNGVGGGRILPNVGTAVIDTNGLTSDITFSVKVARSLDSSSVIVGDQQDFHYSTHGRITRIGF